MKPRALFAAALLAVLSMHAADRGVVGTWRGPENSIISIAPCGGSLCAQVLSTGDETAARVDSNNPDAALRTRPLCGLQIGQGFHGSNPNKAEGGHLYDPRTGKTYKGSLVSQDDVLLLRGYVGISMFGRTARWSRAQKPVEMCRNTPAPSGTSPTPPAIASPAPAASPATSPAPATPAPTAKPSAPTPPTPAAAPAPAPTKATVPDASKTAPQP